MGCRVVRGMVQGPRWTAPGGALAVLLALGAPAASDESAPPQAKSAPDESVRTVLFGSLDAGRSTFASAGFKRSLFGSLDQDGAVGMGTIGYGAYLDPDGSPGSRTVFRETALGSALLGYQWMLPWGVVAGFAGPELSHETVPNRPTGEPHGFRVGARLQGELWAHPTTDTLLTSTLVLGSARGDAWGRVSWGYRVWNNAFLGPEVSAYATDGYWKQQVGAHLTGIELGRFTLRLSTGWRRESDRHTGPYLGLSGHIGL